MFDGEFGVPLGLYECYIAQFRGHDFLGSTDAITPIHRIDINPHGYYSGRSHLPRNLKTYVLASYIMARNSKE